MTLETVFRSAVLAGTVLFCSALSAQPAVVFDIGGKNDSSFNHAASQGMQQWKQETGKNYLEVEITQESEREQVLRTLAQQGAGPIIGVGFPQTPAIAKLAKELPAVPFVIIDGVVNEHNVQSVVFKEQEGSFLVGAMAALSSKTGKIGFIGGMDTPLIRRFQCGYEQGATFANAKTTVLTDMVGTTSAAWNDPQRGAVLAKAQFAQGVDVVFAAAGGTGLGIYQAAKDAQRLAIGVDSNQNHLQSGTMLTSMVKRVDVAVYKAAKSHQPGVSVLGLQEGGVDYAMDRHNDKLVSAELRKTIDALKADIISGKIQVTDYMAHNACKP